MNAVRGVGVGLLCGAFLCVGTAAAEPPAGGVSPGGAPAAGVSAAGGGVGQKADPAAVDAARRLFEQGREAAQRGDWQAAYEAQHEAYAKYRHPQIAGALGDAAYLRSRYPEAIAALSHALREWASMTAEDRAGKEKRLADAKGKCGAVAIEAPAGAEARVDGAEVRVDGAAVGRLPLGDTLYVLPGARTVEVLLPWGAEKRSLEVKAGETVAVKLPPPPPPVPEPPPPRPSMVPAVVLGTAAGLGAVAVGVLVGLSVAKENEAAGLRAHGPRTYEDCLSDKDTCTRIDGLLAERDALVSTGVGVGIGAGIVGMTAVTVAIVQRWKQPAAPVTGAPVVSPTSAGFVVIGSF